MIKQLLKNRRPLGTILMHRVKGVASWSLFARLLPCLILSTLLLSTSLGFSGDRTGYLKRDPLFKNRVNIHDRSGSVDGYLKKDPLFRNRVNIYDSQGRQKGYLKKDYLFEDRTDIYNQTGRQKGYLKQDSLFENRTNRWPSERIPETGRAV